MLNFILVSSSSSGTGSGASHEDGASESDNMDDTQMEVQEDANNDAGSEHNSDCEEMEGTMGGMLEDGRTISMHEDDEAILATV